jgi:undecaprenyl diphosphate synthase
MDGNGRWAKSRNLPTVAGHRAGAESARQITKKAAELGIEFLTLYTFSSENWLRDKQWIDDLMGLLRWYLKNQLNDLMKNGVRLRVIGNRSRLAPDIVDLIEEIEEKTSKNTNITTILALSYGAREEITHAVQNIASKAVNGEIDISQINAEFVSDHLYTAGIPDPDLLIRSSGEQRISNFLLWQSAYSEFVFSNILWPDFTVEVFEKAIYEFQQRKRRYGLYTDS